MKIRTILFYAAILILLPFAFKIKAGDFGRGKSLFSNTKANKIGNICSFQSERKDGLDGYGLVIDPDATGDGSLARFTIQSLTNMMERLGLTADPEKVRVKDVVAVMVTARPSPSRPDTLLFRQSRRTTATLN